MSLFITRWLRALKSRFGATPGAVGQKVIQTISSGDGSNNYQAGRDFNLTVINQPYSVELIDQKIDEEISSLRKSRFFVEFNTVAEALKIADKLTDGDLSTGSKAHRCIALAWCSRLLSRSDELERAEECLRLAKSLGDCEENVVAEAFIISQKGDKNAALTSLAPLGSPLARSAAFMIVGHHDGPEAAITWLATVRTEITGLDSDGRCFLLNHNLSIEDWDGAKVVVASLNEQDYASSPALNHLTAITTLLIAIPAELRQVVLTQVPFNAANFPLAADADAMVARKDAKNRFDAAATVASSLNLLSTANEYQEYALWLELMDPSESESGKNRLKELLGDPSLKLRLVPLALQFGIKLDLDSVEEEIGRQVALHDGITRDAAIARFSLVDRQKSPAEAVRYVERHFDDLSKVMSSKMLRCIQIEAYAKSGDAGKANEILNKLLVEGIADTEEAQLRILISESEGEDPTASLREQFELSDGLPDLDALIRRLEGKKDWEGLRVYGEQLFQRTSSVLDAERYVNALINSNDAERVVELIRANPHLLSQSKMLQFSYARALYHVGELSAAREELTRCDDEYDERNCRALKVNLAIALGDWSWLLVYIDSEYAKRADRDSDELMMTAQLAVQLKSPRAKSLVTMAVNKSDDDPAVLASAYFLATTADWEIDEAVTAWLHRAAELSGDDGPIQKASMQDILDRKPDWDRRESDVWQSLGRGDIPIFLAAQSLNRSLIELFLLPAFANPAESDPRRRSAIPAYSGQRISLKLDLKAGPIGLDPTALLTLSYIGLLEETLAYIDTVYVPHSTLAWLFEEKQKVAFHQPSRIKDARKIRDLLATGSLEKLVPSVVIDSDLAQKVGEELALLIAEAEKEREEDDAQRIVVRSSPVHRLSSLMEEEADVSVHEPVLSSCLAIVKKLHEIGRITAEEEKRASDYLQLHEKPWPNQPQINDGAVLFLDGLSVTYLLHAGLLDKLHEAGFRVILASRALEETDALIDYEGLSTQVEGAIEQIRSVVSSGIESGKIKLGRQRIKDEPEAQSIAHHPTAGMIELANYCDTVVLDDRFFNRHTQMVEGDSKCAISTTLDVLDALASAGVISLAEQRTKLRRAGYFFMPVTAEELRQYLIDSPVKDGQIIENAELKVIREIILCVRMSEWLQLPQEVVWLDATLKAHISVLKGLWKDDVDLEEAKVRSNWLLDQVDIRGWAHVLPRQNGANFSEVQARAHVLILMYPPEDATKATKDAYFEWVEETILVPVKEQSPEMYQWIIEYQKRLVSEISEAALAGEEAD